MSFITTTIIGWLLCVTAYYMIHVLKSLNTRGRLLYALYVIGSVTMLMLTICHVLWGQQAMDELEEMREDINSRLSRQVWNQGSLTNGSYVVLGVYHTKAGCLAVLQSVVITDINVQSRTVAFTNTGGLPRLFSLDTRLADPEDPNSSGLAEVYTGTLKSSIRDYRPFLQIPPKRD